MAFSLARRRQWGLDPADLRKALERLTPDDLRDAPWETYPGGNAVVVVPETK